MNKKSLQYIHLGAIYTKNNIYNEYVVNMGLSQYVVNIFLQIIEL